MENGEIWHELIVWLFIWLGISIGFMFGYNWRDLWFIAYWSGLSVLFMFLFNWDLLFIGYWLGILIGFMFGYNWRSFARGLMKNLRKKIPRKTKNYTEIARMSQFDLRESGAKLPTSPTS